MTPPDPGPPGKPTDDVTVIGCGLMMERSPRTLAHNGGTVDAWNRTHERSSTLACSGITPVESIQDAARAAPLILVCTTTYKAALTPPPRSTTGTAPAAGLHHKRHRRC
ncbi:NAD(P)-binding domain-containing protein [Saccharopolyspora tripterygii]